MEQKKQQEAGGCCVAAAAEYETLVHSLLLPFPVIPPPFFLALIKRVVPVKAAF
jgi:hypothetical protein